MKIGMLIDRYKPYISGITNYVELNKAILERNGHEIYVFTFGDLNHADTETNIVRSPGVPLVDSGYYVSLKYSAEARRLLYTMDIVHIHHPFLSGSLALRYCKPRKIPIIFTNHTRYDLYTQAYLPMLPDIVGETVMSSFLSAFCRQCDLVIAPSAGLAGVLENYGVESPIKVIPNGVDLSPYTKLVEPANRKDFGIEPNQVILVYVGRLGPEKNLPFLLRAFGAVANAYPDVHLILIGDGKERENLEDRAATMNLKNRIHFTGQVPYTSIPSYLAMADAFVTASVTEVHPFSVIEALAAGLPVLGVNSPGVGDSVENEVTGMLVNEDIAEYTAQMVRLVRENKLRRKMGQAARISAQKFDIEQTNSEMMAEYSRLVQDSARTRRGIGYRFTRLFDKWKLT